MSPWEEKGRRHLAELADLLRTGNHPPAVYALFEQVVALARAAFDGKVDGSGSITIPLDMILSLQPTPGGLGIGVPE